MAEKSIVVQSNVNGALVFKGENVIKILDKSGMLHVYKGLSNPNHTIGTQYVAGDYIGYFPKGSVLHYDVDVATNLIPEEASLSECCTVDDECAIDLLFKKLNSLEDRIEVLEDMSKTTSIKVDVNPKTLDDLHKSIESDFSKWFLGK